VQSVQEFAEENMALGSLHYPRWILVEADLRSQAQKLLNAPSKDDIAFTKNTSEALSVVAYGIDWKEGDNVVGTNQEFPSNRIVWESLAVRGVEFRRADLGGACSPEDALFSMTDTRTRLIAVSSVQFSTGLRMNVERVGDFCSERNILLCVDAIQSLGAVQFDVQASGAHFVMADGHKWMLGPEGLALFYCSSEVRDRLSLHQFGWHMVEDIGNFEREDWGIARTSRRFECGSPNMTGIHALNASLSLLLETEMHNIEREVIKKSEYLFDALGSLAAIDLITPRDPGRYAGIVTFRKKGVDNAALYEYLMKQNILCALRSGGIRLSPHFYTPFEKIDEALSRVAAFPS
jgi:cysteine desulfurase/selenocysteine lyase